MGKGESATASAAVTWARRLPPQVARHEAADKDDDGLREDRKEAETDERETEEGEADVLNERREGRIGDKTPVEMSCVGEELQLVTMETVSAVGEQMAEGGGTGDGEHGQWSGVG